MQSDIFNYEHEFTKQEDGKFCLALRISNVKHTVPVHFSMVDQFVELPNNQGTLFCEGFVAGGSIAMPLGAEAHQLTGTPEKPMLSEGAAVIVRDIPPNAVGDELVELVVRVTENCCKVDQKAHGREQHTQQLKHISHSLDLLTAQNDCAERLLRGEREVFTVKFAPSMSGPFLDALCLYGGALTDLARDGSWFHATILLPSEHEDPLRAHVAQSCTHSEISSE